MSIGLARVIVRRIGPDEGRLLRDLRLQSLADAPEAFGQSLDEARAKPEADWVATARSAAQGNGRAWFVAEAAGQAVGIVQARRRPPHAVLIFSMWVAPAARRTGVGRDLIEAAEQWALAWGATHTVLWVFASNQGGRRFYERLGFAVERSGPDAASGAEYDALAMRRSLV